MAQFKTLSGMIEKFVVGRLNAKIRLYLPINLSGLGLIELKEFLMAQQVMWIKKPLSLRGTIGGLAYQSYLGETV